MYLIIWQYQVKSTEEEKFVLDYGSEGRWAEFFRENHGYQGTVLVKSVQADRTYITLDYWDSEEDYLGFLQDNAEQYAAIDRECDNLTESETRIGEYRTP